jgi:chemotaxis protein CheX
MNSNHPVLVAEKQHQDWLPFLEFATREVFEMMLGCQLTKPETTPVVRFNVTAVVGLAGKLSGVIGVRCQEKAAALMASRMLGVELDKVGAEISDALGEVCNMVAGNFKNKISGLGDGCMLSPPSVITGEDYTVHTRPPMPTLEVSLLFETMPLLITLHVHS